MLSLKPGGGVCSIPYSGNFVPGFTAVLMTPCSAVKSPRANVWLLAFLRQSGSRISQRRTLSQCRFEVYHHNKKRTTNNNNKTKDSETENFFGVLCCLVVVSSSSSLLVWFWWGFVAGFLLGGVGPCVCVWGECVCVCVWGGGGGGVVGGLCVCGGG